MKSLGYTNIKSVAGGMIHWEEDNYPFTEKGAYRSGATDTQEERTAAAGPRIAFDRAFHDFGVIPQYGGIVKTAFTVRNNGTSVLTIGTITTSCSCTSASILIDSGLSCLLESMIISSSWSSPCLNRPVWPVGTPSSSASR